MYWYQLQGIYYIVHIGFQSVSHSPLTNFLLFYSASDWKRSAENNNKTITEKLDYIQSHAKKKKI